MTVGTLPDIPVVDARCGGPPDVARIGEAQMRDLLQRARWMLTPPLLAVMDRLSQRWLERTAYEWCCTSGVGVDPEGGVHLLRVLDWQQAGLGRNLVVAWQRGPAGDFANITWSGYVGTITALAPG